MSGRVRAENFAVEVAVTKMSPCGARAEARGRIAGLGVSLGDRTRHAHLAVVGALRRARLNHLCMSTTCRYPKVMAKMIQVRHVPDDVHRRLTDLARQSRTSLSDYLLAELERTSLRPSPKEILARLSKLRPVATRASIVSALREERDRH